MNEYRLPLDGKPVLQVVPVVKALCIDAATMQ
jgi:hypothetical protein